MSDRHQRAVIATEEKGKPQIFWSFLKFHLSFLNDKNIETSKYLIWAGVVFCNISRFRGYLTVSELFSLVKGPIFPIFPSSSCARNSKQLFFQIGVLFIRHAKYPIVYSIF